MMSSRIGKGICLSLIIIVVLIAQKKISLDSQHDYCLLQVNSNFSSEEGNPAEKINASAWLFSQNDFFDRNYFQLSKDKMFYNSMQRQENKKNSWGDRFVHTTRLIKEYTIQDVVRCLDVISAKKNRRPKHIAFIGDSTVRQHFISFLRVSRYICYTYYFRFYFDTFKPIGIYCIHQKQYLKFLDYCSFLNGCI
jgi:hypothetical protein